MKNLQVVLVRAENPVNIGQSARAMKNFSVPKLHLVRCADPASMKALAPGWKARMILKKSGRHKSLDSALKKAAYSIGFTTRSGKSRAKARPFPDMIPEILNRLKTQKVQFVFGNEKNGLSNEELKKCDEAAVIPASKEYSSLNLAHAAALSLGMIYCSGRIPQPAAEPPASFKPKPGEFEAFLKDLEKTLRRLGYGDSGRKDWLETVHADFKIFFKRSPLDRKNLHLFHSLILRTNRRLKEAPSL